jgi:CBS domain-containing protein
VYEYTAGKADWGSFGLPLEGRADSSTRVGSVTRTDVPTCRPDELVSAVAERVGDEWEISVVTNERGVVAGVLDRAAIRSGEPGLVEEAMSLGPRTIRPSARKGKIEQRMRDQNLAHLLVTRSDGTLVGVLRRDVL